MSKKGKMRIGILGWVLAIIGCILLIGSFPAREYISTEICDIMRLLGFACLFCRFIIWSIVNRSSKYEN